MKSAKQRLRRRNRRSRPRRGVLLLVVLSLLVLFLLVGTTFLLIGGQYRTASKAIEQANRTTFQPADLLERALMQIVRDTQNRHSAMRYHSLLRDLYGVDGFAGRIVADARATNGQGQPGLFDIGGVRIPNIAPVYAGVDSTAGVNTPLNNFGRGALEGQFIEFYVADVLVTNNGAVNRFSDFNAVGLGIDEQGLPMEHQLSPNSGYYEGCLLTILDGPCAGSTVRVVGYEHINTNTRVLGNETTVEVLARFRTTVPRRRDGAQLTLGALPADPAETAALTDLLEDNTRGVRFLVNGRPFNGAGVGLNPLAMSHDLANETPSARNSALEVVTINGVAPVYGLELALTPNSTYYTETANVSLLASAGRDPWIPFSGPAFTDTNSFLPLTRGFVAANEAGYDPSTSPLYRTFAGPGDTDESYDAPDYQNMVLASQPLERRLRGRVVNAAGVALDPDAFYAANPGGTPAHLDLDGVPIPSLHRPALTNFWFHRLFNSSWLSDLLTDPSQRVRAILQPYNNNGVPTNGLNAATAAQITAIKRKFMMRPLREDHPGFDGSNPLSRYSTTALNNALNSVNGAALVNGNGEISFPYWEAVGPWDVDNDGDGVPDSVWVDIGLPVQQTEDGRFYKPLAAILVEDLDGRLNLNAHGSEDDLATADGTRLIPSLSAAQLQNLARLRSADLDQSVSLPSGDALNTNLAHDFVAGGALESSNQLPTGIGWGTAEISLRSVLSPTLPLDELIGIRNNGVPPNGSNGNPDDIGYAGNPQYDDYARALFGRPDTRAAGFRGYNAAPVLRERVNFGRYGSAPGFNTGPAATAGLRLTGPGVTLTGVPQPVVSATRVARDRRTPEEFFSWPTFTNSPLEPLNGFATPPDLRGRHASAGLVATGAPVREAIDEATSLGRPSWRERFVNAVDDSPYEIDLSQAQRRLDPASLSTITQSYLTTDPINDDAPFSPAELERILRAFDHDADTLPDRLWRTLDAVDPAKLAAATDLNQNIQTGTGASSPGFFSGVSPNSLQRVVAAARAAINRRQLTTDSWDLPTPNENWTERLILGADGLPGVPFRDANFNSVRDLGDEGDDDNDGRFDEGDEAIASFNAVNLAHTFTDDAPGGFDDPEDTYNTLFANGCDDYVVVMRDDPPSPGRITDYLRYRVVLELKRQGLFGAAVPHTEPALSSAVDNIVFGDNTIATGSGLLSDTRYSFGGLLAPELLAGQRMDLNRPFGDGRDNNGNGVVDEPQEAGEPYTFSVTGGEVRVSGFQDLDVDGLVFQDLDGDGVLFVDDNGDGVPDRFDSAGTSRLDSDASGSADTRGDLADFDGDGVFEPVVDYIWDDLDRDGQRDANEFRPFGYTRGVDANGRGGLVNANVGVRDDGRLARQLFARHLYVLMLLLTDENYLAPYDTHDPQVRHYIDPLSGSVNGTEFADDASVAYRLAFEDFGGDPTVPTTGPDEVRRLNALNNARQRAQLKLTRRRIAQWVVNVVDFRDPDAIQTPFEYDENPWDGWNVVDTNTGAVLPLDGDLSTDEAFLQRRTVSAAVFGVPTPDATNINPAALAQRDRTRGVVWGAERPEVLLTEGVAWHDRRLEDLGGEADEADGRVADAATAPNDRDDDLDQLRKPRGPVFLEATNPWVGDTQRPAEFYSHVDRDGNVTARLPGVRFDRLSNATADPSTPAAARVNRSPVWRISCIEEHPLVRNATVPVSAGGLGLGGGTTPQPARLIGDDLIGGSAADPIAPTYFGLDLRRGPWVYPTSEAPIAYGSGGTINQAPPLHNAYREYLAERNQEALYCLLTPTLPSGDIDSGQFDADGIYVPAGLLERPPTVPDPSFPAFDRFAQPGESRRTTLPMSSLVDEGNGSGEVNREVALKPTTFLERIFYLAPAQAIEALPPGAGGGVAGPGGLLGGLGAGGVPEPQPLNNLVEPGYRVPSLFYQLDFALDPNALTKLQGSEGERYGVEPVTGGLRVYVSKFANGFDRTDLDDNDDLVDANATLAGVQPVQLAPLLPGRRAIIGASGDVHEDDFPNAPARTPTTTPGDYPVTFLGDDAESLAKRYVTVMAQPAVVPTTVGGGLLGTPPAFTKLRRLEMIPSPNPNDHQFAIRMNGLNEALSVLDVSEGVNATLGEGLGEGPVASPALLTTPPVIAVPIDNLSISEPIDQYLTRQLELDPELNRSSLPNTGERTNNTLPAEEVFSSAPAASANETTLEHFDEPFDLLPELIENQTTPNYRSVHLERLANPLLPWNPPPVRPNGETPEGLTAGTSQHNPNLPVNPYLPVDAQSLDLTAFNGYSDQEGSVRKSDQFTPESMSVAPGPDNSFGAEHRHRRRRVQPDQTITAAQIPDTAGGDPDQAAIGFVSNERGRPLGPFPKLWLYEPSRLLWRQGGAATLTEIAHQYALDTYNGYLAGGQDRLLPRSSGGTLGNPTIGVEGTAREARQMTASSPSGAAASYEEHFVDFPWRMTLGFSNFWSNEFVTGGEVDPTIGLRWFADPAGDGSLQSIDLDGSNTPITPAAAVPGDLIGQPEVTTVLNTIANDGRTAEAFAANFDDAALDTDSDSAVDAREFFEGYLRQHADTRNHTTPAFSWPNRPLASAGELLQVPVWGGSRMLTYYSVFNWQRTQTPFFESRLQANPYNGEAGADFDHDGLDYSVASAVTIAPFTFDGDFGNDFQNNVDGDGNGNPDVDNNGDGYVDTGEGVPDGLPDNALIVDADGRPEEGPTNVLRWRETLGHFGHLMNFFQTARFPSAVFSFARERMLGDPDSNEEYIVPQGAPHFYRLLDYVHTPSRFTATQTLLSADTFAVPGLAPDDVRSGFAAPFNRLSNYREPGRVNLNTIVGRSDPTDPAAPADRWSEVYDGLMHRTQDESLIDYGANQLLRMGHLGPAWRDVELSRRGYVQPDFDPRTNGGAVVDYSPGRLHPDFPTRFANPFRAPGEGANVPLTGMVQTGVDATLLRAHPLSPGADGAWGRRGIDDATVDKSGDSNPNNNGVRDDASEAGLLTLEIGDGQPRNSNGSPSLPVDAADVLRRLNADVVLARFDANGDRGALPDTFMEDAFRPTNTALNPREVSAVFARNNEISNAEISKRATPVPLFSGAALEPSLDTERNSTTRYQPIQRLSNLTTTRSNVYAVWITIGFFEVTQAAENPQIASRYFTGNDDNGDGSLLNDFVNDNLRETFFQVYPEGWTLGEELGFDTGTNRRHRGFYVVDRSLPVGFRPGEDLNASETVLVRRRIE